MADQVKIEIDVETRAAIANLTKLAGSLEDVEKEAKKVEKSFGQKVWKELNTDVEQLGKGMRGFGKDLGAIFTALGSVAAGALAVGVALGAATAHAEKSARAYRTLGDQTWALVQAQTAGAVSIEQANKAHQTLVRSGLNVTGRELATLTRAAREYALATGTEMEQALEKLTEGLRGGSADALQEFGIRVADGAGRVATMHGALRQLEAGFRGVAPAAQTTDEAMRSLGTNFLDVVSMGGRFIAEWTGVAGLIREVGELTAGAANALREYFDARDRLKASNARDDANATSAERYERAIRQARSRAALAGVSADFRQLPRFAQLDARRRDEITARLEGFLPQAGSVIGGALGGRRPTYRADGTIVQSGAGARAIGDDLLTNGPLRGLDMSGALSSGNAISGLGRAADALATTGNADARSILDAATAAQAATTRDEARARRAATRPRRELNSGVDPALAQARRKYQQALARAIVLGAAIVSISPRPGQTPAELLEAKAEAQEVANTAREQEREAVRQGAETVLQQEREDEENWRAKTQAAKESDREERARGQRLRERDRETRRRARNESVLGRITGSLGMERDDNGNLKSIDALGMGLKGIEGTFSTLQSLSAEFFETIATGALGAGEAAQLMGSKFLSALGQMAIQEGTAMLFKALPAMIEAPPLGVAYLAGGAGLIGIGLALGAAGAATKPPTPSASAGASASSDRNVMRSGRAGSLTNGNRDGLGSTTVVMASLVPSGVTDAVNARNSLRQVRRSGLDDGTRAPRRIEY